MPELPEVETVRRGLSPFMEGERIVAAWKSDYALRKPMPIGLDQLLIGQVIKGIERRSKYLLFRLSSENTLLLHLGMSGCCLIENKASLPERPKHVHFEIELENNVIMRFQDPRRFGQISLFETDQEGNVAELKRLGVEPLSNHFNEAYLMAKLHNKKANIKSALLDQHVIAGLGNIYVSEALWLAAIHPESKAMAIGIAELNLLATSIRTVLNLAIKSGGSSLRDHKRVNGELGYFQHQFNAYDKDKTACARVACKGMIKRIVQSGRSSYYCDQHQIIYG